MKEERKMKKQIRFNLLDAVLVVLALLCVIGIWQRANLQKLFTPEGENDDYIITFEVKRLRSTTADLLDKDTLFYIEENGEREELGKLSERVSASAATVYLQDASGNTVSAVYPESSYEYLLDVSGSLQCRGMMSDGAFLLNGKVFLAVNQTVSVRTERADLEIRVVSISPAA